MISRTNTLIIPALLLFIALYTSPAYSATYKWVDTNGDIHYTQYKPTHVKSSKVGAPPPVPSNIHDSNAEFAEQIRSAGQQSSDNKASQKEAKQKKAALERRKKNCANARKNLSILQNDRRVTTVDEVTNEIVTVNDDMRAEKIKQTEKEVENLCD